MNNNGANQCRTIRDDVKWVSDCVQPKEPEHLEPNKEFILTLDLSIRQPYSFGPYSHGPHNVKSYLLSIKQQQTQLATYW